MYSDNSLTPREAIRLCALGILAQSEAAGNLTYDELVYSVRYFVSMLTGPSLDLMGESIELLRHEDLVEIYEDGTSQQKLKITESSINEFLYTKGVPDPDILIRTGNTNRLSNFLLWQLSYSEIFFVKKLWPDFSIKDYNNILLKFENIKRNFGNIS